MITNDQIFVYLTGDIPFNPPLRKTIRVSNHQSAESRLPVFQSAEILFVSFWFHIM